MSGKTKGLIILLLSFCLGIVAFPAYCFVPEQLSYQGRLTDAAGVPVPDSTYEITFTLYDELSVLEWTETQSTVDVTNGVFTTLLPLNPALSPFPPGLFDKELFLGIKVGSDGEMTPRQLLSSVPFSIKAGDADTFAGHIVADFADVAHSHDFSDISGIVDDGQIPDDITIDYADNAGSAANATNAANASDADNLDGRDSTSFADAAHNHDSIYAPESHVHDDRYYSMAHIDAMDTRIANLENITAAQNALIDELLFRLAHFSREGNDITISGANLHINSGSGDTNGGVNGLGNLIVGYNEERVGTVDRSGSHNIVVGSEHNYSSFGGLVAGFSNTIRGEYASVIGGHANTANGNYSNISGGYANLASGYNTSVSSGVFNTASGYYSSVSGGDSNTASGERSSVSGGAHNTAAGNWSSVTGGGGSNDYEGNIAFANYSTILGGHTNGTGDVSRIWNGTFSAIELIPGINHTIGETTTVSGGSTNISSGNLASISGGDNNTASGLSASVSGGQHNTASSDYASVSGGGYNTASGYHASVSGGGHNTGSGSYANVSGGRNNTAIGDYSSIAGGGRFFTYQGNIAFANYSTILGGHTNATGDVSRTWNATFDVWELTPGTDQTIGEEATVSGGSYNIASGNYASVSGGDNNTASNSGASISGGSNNIANGYSANVSGGIDNVASGNHASISGGGTNIASGGVSSVSSGYNNTASVGYASVSGGINNAASGGYASVSGGDSNWANGESSSISGGYLNIVGGESAAGSVSGGFNRSVSGPSDWRAGELFQDN